MPYVSVIICTRNRADFLRDTLRSLADVSIPQDYTVELVVVDNGSTDDTQDVVQKRELPQFHDVRLIEEPEPGLSHARNTAVAHANGDILLFTDDDVRVPDNWITGMTAPICTGAADAVAGGVELAPHLRRPWQEENPGLTSPLAATRDISSDNPDRMVGANMAIAKYVFKRLPPFDPNLDAGSPLGLGGDTLFSYHLREAGFRLTSAFDVAVEHHCDPDRLSRQSYLKYAEKVGRSEAYIDYHWHEKPVSPFRLGAGLVRRYARLLTNRLVRYQELQAPEGIPEWEFRLLLWIYYRWQLLIEQGRARKYSGVNFKKKKCQDQIALSNSPN